MQYINKKQKRFCEGRKNSLFCCIVWAISRLFCISSCSVVNNYVVKYAVRILVEFVAAKGLNMCKLFHKKDAFPSSIVRMLLLSKQRWFFGNLFLHSMPQAFYLKQKSFWNVWNNKLQKLTLQFFLRNSFSTFFLCAYVRVFGCLYK